MKERPILFSGPMVRAILEGRKTQTRRVLNPQPTAWESNDAFLTWAKNPNGDSPMTLSHFAGLSPYGQAGDQLWVRETFWPRPFRTPRDMREGADTWPAVFYDADKPDADCLQGWGWKRKPSIFLPRALSRIGLEITNVRVERLRDISEQDARSEGMLTTGVGARASFMVGWDSINGKRKGCTWSDNPWVWVIEFKRVEAAQQKAAA